MAEGTFDADVGNLYNQDDEVDSAYQQHGTNESLPFILGQQPLDPNGVHVEDQMVILRNQDIHGDENGVEQQQQEQQHLEYSSSVALQFDDDLMHRVVTTDDIFKIPEIKEYLAPEVSALTQAEAGKAKAKIMKTFADEHIRERIKSLKKELAVKKNEIAAWLLKRRSLCSRVCLSNGKLAYAKFVVKNYTIRQPDVRTIASTYKCYIERRRTPNIVVKHYVNMAIAKIHGVATYLDNNLKYVERMNKISATSGNETYDVRSAITMKKVVLRTVLDLLMMDFMTFNCDLVVNCDDQSGEYDYIAASSTRPEMDAILEDNLNAENVNPGDNISSVLDIVGRHGGNREQFRADMMKKAVANKEMQFFQSMFGSMEDATDGRDETMMKSIDPTKLSSDADTTAIIMYFLDPMTNPTSEPPVIAARIAHHWKKQLKLALNGDPHSAVVCRCIHPPIGLLSHEQAVAEISTQYENNTSYTKDRDAFTEMPEDLGDFCKAVSLLHHCRDMFHLEALSKEQNLSSQEIEHYNALRQVYDRTISENSESFKDTVLQCLKTRDQFAELNITDPNIIDPSVQRPGTAVRCFPDHCESLAAAAGISDIIDKYLATNESLDAFTSATSKKNSVDTWQVEEVAKRIKEELVGPDDSAASDTDYFVHNHSAPWIEEAKSRLKEKCQYLADRKAKYLDSITEDKIDKTIVALVQERHVTPEEADSPVLRNIIRANVQKPAEEYAVKMSHQIQDRAGNVKIATVSFESADVVSKMKASKTTDKSALKWKTIVMALTQLIDNIAVDAERKFQSGENDSNIWSDEQAVTTDSLFAAVFELLTPMSWESFISTLLVTMKTVAENQAKEDNEKSNKKKRKQITELLGHMDDGEEAASSSETIAAKLLSSRGRLSVQCGSNKKAKKGVTVFENWKD